MSFRESLSLGLTDRCTVAAYVYVNTTNSGPNYTTSGNVTRNGLGPCASRRFITRRRWPRATYDVRQAVRSGLERSLSVWGCAVLECGDEARGNVSHLA